MRFWSSSRASDAIATGRCAPPFPAERVTAALIDLVTDEDARVHGPALEALARVLPRDSPELQRRLATALEAADFAERGTAARLVGETKPDGAAALLSAAYTRGLSDTAYDARGGALEGLAALGGEAAIATIRTALNDREWPIRVRAATLLRGLGQTDVMPTLPAPVRQTAEFFASEALLHPRYSPRALIDTRYGRIEVQLDVVAAPVTSAIFVELARSGFFNGIKVHRLVPTFVIQAGDPRGDGEGGPGFTMRDELSPMPYLRGTVGMALAWADTGGSQWFITLSPQPHLDGRYAVFGRVVGGWDVLDQVSRWDVIERVWIWDGVELK
jgi:cyclophilin family peptidyl-prolyl cis-trans isomerase